MLIIKYFPKHLEPTYFRTEDSTEMGGKKQPQTTIGMNMAEYFLQVGPYLLFGVVYGLCCSQNFPLFGVPLSFLTDSLRRSNTSAR